MSPNRQPVAVVVGATSKWQADGRNTKLAHGKALDDRDLPGQRLHGVHKKGGSLGVDWSSGGADGNIRGVHYRHLNNNVAGDWEVACLRRTRYL